MMRAWVTAMVAATLASAGSVVVSAADDPVSLGGTWAINRTLSEFPKEIGFIANWAISGAEGGGRSGDAPAGGGRGRRGSGGGTGGSVPLFPTRESSEDAKRLQLLTTELRNPSSRLTVTDTLDAFTLTDDRGVARTFHPTGRAEVIDLGGSTVEATTRREGSAVIISLHVEAGRDLRYTYSRVVNPPQLVVDVQVLERGNSDRARRIYEPASAVTSIVPATPAAAGSNPAAPQAPAFDSAPGAELRGLKQLGLVVEEFSAQAASCGLGRETVEADLAKRLGAGGFTVRRNADEDTYLYVTVLTSTLSGGLCVSRYDAYVYSNTTATLSHHARPVLVQASLLHRGGISAGAPATHGAAVLKSLQDYVDAFVTQIRDANK